MCVMGLADLNLLVSRCLHTYLLGGVASKIADGGRDLIKGSHAVAGRWRGVFP